MIDPAGLALAIRLGAATMHEAAGRIGALPAGIKPVNPKWKLAGPAFTVDSPPGDNLWIHRAIYAARPGDVLVVCPSGGIDWGYWGDIMNTAAIACGLGGLVINGGVRDTGNLVGMGFPVFSNGISIRGTEKDAGASAFLNAPTRLGEVIVQPGDLMVGDRDGVVAIPAASAQAVLEGALAREFDETEKLRLIREGARTIDLYGLGAGHSAPWA